MVYMILIWHFWYRYFRLYWWTET